MRGSPELKRDRQALLDKDKLLQSIFRISSLLTAPADLDEVLATILDELVETIGFDKGIIRLFDESKRYLETKVVKNFTPEETQRAFATPLDIKTHDCIAAKVMKSGELIAIEDTSQDPRITETDRKLANIYDRGSIFCAPLKIGDDLIGTVVCWRKEETRFFPEEINLLLTFARHISIIIHNTRLFETNAEKIRELTILQEAVSEMNLSGVQIGGIAGILLHNAVRIAQAEKGLVYLSGLDEEQCLVYEGGVMRPLLFEEIQRQIEKSIIKESMETNRVLLRTVTEGDRTTAPFFTGYATEIVFPVYLKNKPTGFLYLAKKRGNFSQNEQNVLDILLTNAAISYENAMMHALLSQEAESLKTEVDKLKKREDMLLGFHNILGKSEKMLHIFRMVEEVSAHNTHVLIQGASGTGKELLARAIHKQSNRHNKPFVDVNCAAIPGTLLESELFGYEAGAFTDAKKRKIGLIEYAQGGTLFLDEIGEMPLTLQAKFLRVLEDGHIRRLGGTESIPIDVRFIFATNRDLSRMVAEGTFREDLYYRISVVPIHIPPLRERSEDIILLAEYFLEEFNKKFGKKVKGFSKEAKQALLSYPWPGNVRELRNIVERVMIAQDVGPIIKLESLPAEIRKGVAKGSNVISLDGVLPPITEAGINFAEVTAKVLEETKRQIIAQALTLTKGNKSKAAKLLGISRYKLLREAKKSNQS